ncbi:MAG: chromosome segregation protein SMC, partial [Fusobacteriaceae bacterium]
FINDTKARLKDISGMFLDTGIGKSAYSVIGQGKVERIISSSSKEIKWIIEEAAGIKKFQVQKQEALRNLKNLEDELEKISLVMKQIGENRDHIEKQASKAKEYLDIKTEKESLEKGVLTFDINKKSKSFEELTDKKNSTEQEIKNIEENINKNEEFFLANEKEREELTSMIEGTINKNSELKEKIEMSEREKARITERLESFSRELEEKKEQSEKIQTKIKEQKDHVEFLKSEQVKINEQIENLEIKNKEYSEIIDGLENVKRTKEMDQEILKRKLMDLEVEKLKVVNEIENSERRAKTAEGKIEKFKEEISEFEKKSKELDSEMAKLLKEKEEQEKKVKEISERGTFLEEKISFNSTEVNKIVEKIRELEFEEKRSTGRLQNLIRLEESNEGLFKGVKEVLNEKINGVHGIVAANINIPAGLEKAIEAAIPGNFQDIIVENSEVAKKCIDVLKIKKAGRASFLALDTIKPASAKRQWVKGNGVVGIASNLVTSDPKYKIVVDFLLGNLLVVEHMDKALDILRAGEHGGNIATLNGELVSARGRVTGGEAQNSQLSSIIERKQEKKQLEITLENVTKQLKVHNDQADKIREELDKYENEIFEIDGNVENAKKVFRQTT